MKTNKWWWGKQKFVIYMYTDMKRYITWRCPPPCPPRSKQASRALKNFRTPRPTALYNCLCNINILINIKKTVSTDVDPMQLFWSHYTRTTPVCIKYVKDNGSWKHTVLGVNGWRSKLGFHESIFCHLCTPAQTHCACNLHNTLLTLSPLTILKE